MDSTIPLMQGVLAALTSVCSGRVYGEVPANPTYPYAVASSEATPFDSASFSGQTHTVRVQIFSRSGKPGEALKQRALVHDLLHESENTTEVDGFSLVQMRYSMSDYFKEDDGKTWQAVIEFSALVE